MSYLAKKQRARDMQSLMIALGKQCPSNGRFFGGKAEVEEDGKLSPLITSFLHHHLPCGNDNGHNLRSVVCRI